MHSLKAGLKAAQIARLQRLVGHMFGNGTVSRRKQAAKTLTNNAAERWNDKIERAPAGVV